MAKGNDMGWIKDVGIGLGLTLGAGIATVIATKEIKKGSEGAVGFIEGLVKNAIETGKAHKELAATAAETATEVAESVSTAVETATEAVS